jgi:hypothetical protein
LRSSQRSIPPELLLKTVAESHPNAADDALMVNQGKRGNIAVWQGQDYDEKKKTGLWVRPSSIWLLSS